MLKMMKCLFVALALFSVLTVSPATAVASQESFLDRHAYNPFAIALAVAGAGISVASAANAVKATAAVLGGAAEVVVVGATAVGGATLGTVILAGIGVGVGAVLIIATGELTCLFENAQGAARDTPAR